MGNYTELAVDLKLSGSEHHIFSTLNSILGTGTPRFIAGGCVRDAILGVPRNDIDVFITNLNSHTNIPRLIEEIDYRVSRLHPCDIVVNESRYENSSIITVIKVRSHAIDIVLCKDSITKVVDNFDLNVNQAFVPLYRISHPLAFVSDAFIQALQDNVIRCTPEFIKVIAEDIDIIDACAAKATRLKNKFNKTTGIPKNICCKITPQQLRKFQGEAKWRVDLGIASAGARGGTINIDDEAFLRAVLREYAQSRGLGDSNFEYLYDINRREWAVRTASMDGQSVRVDRVVPTPSDWITSFFSL